MRVSVSQLFKMTRAAPLPSRAFRCAWSFDVSRVALYGLRKKRDYSPHSKKINPLQSVLRKDN